MALGTDQLTKTLGQSGQFIDEIWSKDILLAQEARLILANLVKRYDAAVSVSGDILRIPNLSNLTANTKAANTQVTLQAPSETPYEMAIDQHKETSFLVEDILKAQSKYDLRSEYTNKAGYAIAQNVDTALAGLYSGLSQSVGDGNTAITEANLASGIQYLDDANAPEEDRYLVIRGVGKRQIALIARFTEHNMLGLSKIARPVRNGAFGEVHGVNVYVTTQIIVVSGTPDVVHNLLFHREAFALAIQKQSRVQADYILEYLGHLVVVDILYGYKELRDTFGVDFRSSNQAH